MRPWARWSPPLVSAHRPPDLDLVLDLGVDYVELDVHRRPDGTFVVAHDERDEHAASYAEVLRRIAGRAGAHIDLKVRSADGSAEVAAAQQAVAVLDAGAVLLTSESVVGVRALRDWADAEGLGVRVGLSVGRPVGHLSWLGAARLRLAELRSTAVRDSRADVVVARHTLARLGMAWLARRAGLPLLVWTVDSERSLHYWTRPGRCWMVTTNRPDRALGLRSGLRGSGS